MKTKKLIPCFILSLVLSMGLFDICQAAASVTVDIGRVQASAGQQFSLDISVDNVPSNGISCMDFALQYDKNVINLTSITPVGEIAGSNTASNADFADFASLIDNSSGYAYISWLTTDSSKYIKSKGAIITLTGNVLSAAPDNASTDIKIIAAPRDTYPNSGIANTSVIMADAASGSGYNIAAVSGNVSVSGSADNNDSLRIALTNVSTAAGGKAYIDASLLNVPENGVSCMDFAIKYDKNIIAIDSVKPVGKIEGSDTSQDGSAADFAYEIDSENGFIYVSWATIDNSAVINQDGTIITIGCTVSSSASNTVSELSIKPVNRETYPNSGIANSSALFTGFSSVYDSSFDNGSVTVMSKGDVDKDGDVDNIDAAIVLRYVSAIDKTFDTSKYDMTQADCDGVKGINISDVIWIMNHQTAKGNSESSTESTTASQTGSAAYNHSFTDSGTVSDFFIISGNTANNKGSVSYNGKTLTQCLKIETATSIKFTAKKSGTLTLVFGGDSSANNKAVKIDNSDKIISDNGTNELLTIQLAAGEHTIAKKDAVNLYYISFIEN